ncbi:MAG: L,D-transpeptidase [Streptosporangiaceae bacterium]
MKRLLTACAAGTLLLTCMPGVAEAAAATVVIEDVTPNRGETVGIGMPIIVWFKAPVRNKKAVEGLLRVKSAKSTVGAWLWTSRRGRQVAIFRAKKAWPARQQVTFTAKLPGRTTKVTFRIGNAHVIRASAKTHKLVATSNGRVVRRWGVSMGKGGDVWADGIDHQVTTSGVHLVMEKLRQVRMTPPGLTKQDPGWYDEIVPWANRLTDSGEYLHQAMEQLSCLGRKNCSHGCVRSPGKDAKWFTRWAYRGDPVVITGTKRRLKWNNGWSYYQVPFATWVRGGALKRPVTT